MAWQMIIVYFNITSFIFIYAYYVARVRGREYEEEKPRKVKTRQ